MAFLSRSYRAPNLKDLECFWIVSCDLLALRTSVVWCSVNLYKILGLALRSLAWCETVLGAKSEQGHPQIIIFKLCSPKTDHFILFYGDDPHFQTQPLGTLIYLAWHWDAMNCFWCKGSKGTRHNAPFDAFVKASSANAESLYDLGLIQKGFTDFNQTWACEDS